MKAAKGTAKPGTPSKSGEWPTANGHRIRAAVPSAPRPRFLLVEDREDVGETLKKTLERWVDVTWARTHDEAVTALSNQVFSALIADVRLEGPSGFVVLEKFRELHPRTPAMVLTGYFAEVDSARACELGAQYVAKPITMDGLQRFIEDAKPEPLPLAPASVGLTRAEQEVFGLLARRFSNGEVAEALDISVETARSHVKHVLAKLGIRSRKEISSRQVRITRSRKTPKITLFGGCAPPLKCGSVPSDSKSS